MKTLIIYGSPRKNGDSAFLAESLAEELGSEIVRLSVYRDSISPCVDCRYCSSHPECAIKDDMQVIYSDDFDAVVIASPVYMSTLPGPMVSLISRFQVYYAAKRFLGKPVTVRSKSGALILTGGGDGSPEEAARLSKHLLRRMGVELRDENTVMSLNTDSIPAQEDYDAILKIRQIAERLLSEHNQRL